MSTPSPHSSRRTASLPTLSPTLVRLVHSHEAILRILTYSSGRNGVQPTKQQAWGDWCNVIGTGFGIRPSTTTDDPLLDAYVWVKPGGEGDGTSDTSAVRYDAHCGLADAFKPAPEAGTWFQAYFEQLLVNASPAF
jgi:cellulose 1,4-beta-cellobiosidase